MRLRIRKGVSIAFVARVSDMKWSLMAMYIAGLCT